MGLKVSERGRLLARHVASINAALEGLKGKLFTGASKDALVYMLGRGLTGLAGFWSIPLLVRLLGASEYGRYSMLVFETIIFPQVAAGWLQQATLRYRQEWLAKGKGEAFLATQRRFAFPIAGITAVVTGGFAAMLHGASPGLTVAVALIGGQSALQIVLLATVQADLRPLRVVLAELFRVLVPLVILLSLSTRNSISLLSAMSLTATGWTVSLLVLIQAKQASAWGDSDPDLVNKMFRFGLPMALWFLLNSGQIYAGRLFLSLYADAQWLGIYSIFQDMSIKLGSVSLLPIIYAVHANGMALVGRKDLYGAGHLIRRSYSFIVVMIVFITLAWLLVPGPIARIVIGPREVALAIQHKWLGAGIIFSTLLGSLGLLAHKSLEFRGRTDLMVVWAALALGLGVLTTLCGIHIHSAGACALGLLVGNLVYVIATQVAGTRA